MYLAVVALHIVLCVVLVFVILLQPGKGGDMGASFGGSGSNIFGPRGPTSVLAQMTTGVAVMFMVTSITLAWFSNKEILANSNVMDELERAQEQRDAKAAKEAEEAAQPVEAPPVAPVVPVEPETPPADPAGSPAPTPAP